MIASHTAGGELSPLKRAIVEIRALRERVAELERLANEPIALIGLGMRLPGGCDGAAAFWRLLCTGGDAVGPLSADRWESAAGADDDPAAITRRGAFLSEVDRFAAPFFAISPREAAQMDPQHRLLLQVAWEALEDAGQAPDRLAGSATGVFIGICNSDYARLLAADPSQIDVYLATGSAPSIAAGRISYLLGLHGPSLAIDTACSSSLVAVHLAVRSLRSRECDLALVGGVNLILSPEITLAFDRAGMMARDGRCKTFDAAADGYVRGEGCAVVALKRLRDALTDGDRVLAVIRGTAVNQDGRSGGLTAPNGPAQTAVIRAALADGGVSPEQISYVEAHGTGTALGDPIEVQAIAAALGAGRPAARPLLIGSVKTNIGHLEAAAGLVGLIKTALMLRHGQLVPHLHLTTPSPHIPWPTLPVRVVTTHRDWDADGPRRAGVSSFGFSGTNAHVVLEQPVAAPLPAPAVERPRHLLTLSAKTELALRQLAGRLAVHLADHPEAPLADVAFTANCGRAQLAHRLALVADDGAGARARLAAFANGEGGGVVSGQAAEPAPEVVFLVTGHGAHYPGLGAELYATQPVFRAALDRCDALLRSALDRSLPEILFGDAGLLHRMAYAQPALFAVQFALAELWRSWGVHPAAVAGHSAGEYVAAVLAGVLSLEDGLRVVAARGRLMETLAGDGVMVALFVDEARVAPAIQPHADQVSIAAVNGPAMTVISGRRAAVQAVIAALALEPDEYRELDVGVAAHSPLVEPMLTAFEAVVTGVTLAPPQIQFVSSLTGDAAGAAVTRASYWRRQVREPVRFAAVMDSLRGAGYTTFVEIGPQATLLRLGQRCWPDAGGTWVASLCRDGDAWTHILTGLATLYTAGVPVDWAGFDRPYDRRKLALPTYPWQNDRYWVAAGPTPIRADELWPAVVAATHAQAEQGPLDLRVESYADRWQRLDALADAYIIQALRELHLFGRAGEAQTVDDIITQHGIAPSYRRLLTRWLTGLAESGRLRRVADDRFVTAEPLAEPDLTGRLASARAAFADAVPVLAYVRRCGERLAAVLTGAESALTTLFPDGSFETADYLYHHWAMARYFNGIVRAAATAASRPGRALRVLEIGAGTGGTTAALLPTLAPRCASYDFTDVSDFFLARAAERFAGYPTVRYQRLDIEQPPEAQGYPARQYDLVIAANVLHATGDLDATLRHARMLLAPGGVLILYETTRHPRWFDITTGLIAGWQRFADDWRGDHPLLPAEVWGRALARAGFADVVAVPGPEQPAAVFGQSVIVAHAPVARLTHQDGVVRAPAATPIADDAGAEPAPPAIRSDVSAHQAALAAALPEERHDRLVDVVRHAIARVLRLEDPRVLRRDQPLLDLGFDSLMAVELRNVLRQGLELDGRLPATLIYDCPTIGAIAAYLEPLIGGHRPVAAAATVATTRSTRTSAEQIATLSDDEVTALLEQKLVEL